MNFDERVLLVKNVLSSQNEMREISRELHCQMLSQKKLLGKHLQIH